MRRVFQIGVGCLFAVVSSAGCSSTDERGQYAGLYSDDPVKVQQLTILLTQARDLAAIPHLIENLDHSDPYVRLQTHMALLTTTEQKVTIPFDYLWPDDRIKAGQRAWKSWYETEGASLTTPSEKPREG